MNWTSNYHVGQSVDYFAAPAIGWRKAKIIEIWNGGMRVNPDDTSFGIAVTEPERIKPT